MGQVLYESKAKIERVKGPVRLAWIPGEKDPVTFGVHGAIAEHYGVSPDKSEPRATTIDYVIAATGG